MKEVYNWQIKRKMQYPFDEPKQEKQFAAVFDINKCIGCQTCSISCKTTWTTGRGQEYMFWNNVESKPYGGYPLYWDFKLLEKIGGGAWKDGSYAGKTIFEKAAEENKTVEGFLPALEDWSYPNMGEDEIYGGDVKQGMHIETLPHPIWFFYLPRICNHCTYPACVANCPRQAVYKRPEDGIVLIDQSRCQGYKQCTSGCPYKKPMFNATTYRSEKCVACYPKVEEGLQTQCMEHCIGKIRMQGWLSAPDKAKEDNPIDYLVHIKKLALPLYPQFGTQPNVYYIPPIHVPTPYMKQMFGPGVEHAVKTYREVVPNDSVLKGLLVLFGSSPQIMTKFEVKNEVAHGYNSKGELVAQAPIKEPEALRESYDKKLDVYRLDVT
ncbi:4Fe-4S dicluster domain-containing protein [Candidatus Magnetobacterium casense]|uniref:Dehydrogenase n=1 Tax=Candidatus Magnetobacterium casense TaxID=1455061 RepID=A0ABS6S2J5_9BACT|nr:4Fe-4S dicluster domain-containing protein [Candidatus Magnetobacterium casensis]MBV6342624.1 dehydrogenase [Candidatus Magnetobacterium casensis]